MAPFERTVRRFWRRLPRGKAGPGIQAAETRRENQKVTTKAVAEERTRRPPPVPTPGEPGKDPIRHLRK